MLLLGLTYSPWTERARWALDHHRLAYRFIKHEPVLGELSLRVRLRRFRGRVTVPVLQTGEERIGDSVEIARYADAHGYGSPLLPKDLEGEVLACVALAERALDAARGIVVRATLESDRALTASTPPFLPSALKLPVARFGTKLFAAKYGLGGRTRAGDLEALSTELEAIRSKKKGETMLGSFTFADIAVAGALQVVRPVADRHWHVNEVHRLVWRAQELEERFSDLLAWRDALYDEHR